jgi:hypothetical protein
MGYWLLATPMRCLVPSTMSAINNLLRAGPGHSE